MLNEVEYEAEGDPQQPLTRAEFSEAMQFVGQAFDKVVTKDELKQLEGRLGAKIETELDKWGKLLFRKIDAAVEQRQIDLGAAKTETVTLQSEQLGRHESRIAALERKARLSA